MFTLKRVTDPDYLLCHKCGKRLDGSAHKKCAEAALKESKFRGKESSKIKHASSSRPFEGVGTIGHSPCRLEDGSVIIPADEVRKIREEGFVHRITGVKYGPWTNGRMRERSRVQKKNEAEEIIEEIEAEIEEWDVYTDKEDLYSLAHGCSSKGFINKLFSSEGRIFEISDEEDE